MVSGGESLCSDVNPARAGMILAGVRAGLEEGRKPRASGDDPRG